MTQRYYYLLLEISLCVERILLCVLYTECMKGIHDVEVIFVRLSSRIFHLHEGFRWNTV